MKNNLNCENFENRIHQLLDDRLTLTGDPLLMDHASRCANCNQLVLVYEELTLAIPLISPDEPVWPDDNFKVAAEASTGKKIQHRQKRPSHVGMMVSLAASLLLMVGVLWMNDSTTPSTALHQPSNQVTSPMAPTLAVAVNKNSKADLPDGLSTDTHSKHPIVNCDSTIQPQDRLINKLVFYQPPTFVELAQQTPELVNSVQIPTSNVWNEFSKQLDPLNPYLHYSSEIPGIRKVQCSVNMTIELLQRSLRKSESPAPDLGWFIDTSPLVVI